MIVYPDGISGPPSAKAKKKGKGKPATKGIPGKTPGPWRSGYVLPGKGKPAKKPGNVIVGGNSSTALATTGGADQARAMWPWILGGLGALVLAFWYTRKGKGGGRRPLGFA